MIRRLLDPFSSAVLWCGVWQFFYPRPKDQAQHQTFLRWWRQLQRMLDRGHWIAVFEPRSADLVIHTFFGLRPGQEPIRFWLNLTVVSPPVSFNPKEYDYRYGIGWYLRELQGPSAVALGPTIRRLHDRSASAPWRTPRPA